MIRKVSLIIPTLLMLTFVMGFMSWLNYTVSMDILSKTMLKNENSKADDIHFILETLLEKEISRIKSIYTLIKGNKDMFDAFSFYMETKKENKPLMLNKIMHVLETNYKDIDVDFVFIKDDKNSLIYSMEASKIRKEIILKNFTVSLDYEPEDVAGFNSGDMAGVVSSLILYKSEKEALYLFFGRILDDVFAKYIAFATDAHITLGTESGIIASSIPIAGRDRINFKELKKSIVDISVIRREYIKENKVVHYSPLEILDELIGVMIELDSTDEKVLLNKNREYIIKNSLIMLVVSWVIGFAFLIFVLKPLKKLQTDAVKTIFDITGENIQSVSRGNEVTSLVNFFNIMIGVVDNHIKKSNKAQKSLKLHKKDLENQVEERTAAITESNKELSLSILQLKKHTDEMLLLNQMSEILQACESEAESFKILDRFCNKLFCDDSGYFTVLNNSKIMLHVIFSWGKIKPEQDEFHHNKCWAIRRGKVNMVEDPLKDPLCPHVKERPGYVYFCIPIVAKTELVGMLHLAVDVCVVTSKMSPKEKMMYIAAKQMLAISLLEHYSPCLVNIRLLDTLKTQSIKDSLTGLFNRRYLESSVDREISRLGRRGLEMGVIMLDVDHFKSFNDIYDHATGDAVLKALGVYLQNSVREEDIACRYGGEEFVLLMPEANLEVTYERAEAIRKGIKKEVSVTGKNEMLNISVSLGVSVYPKHGKNSAELIGKADFALYKAKAAGRDRTEKAE